MVIGSPGGGPWRVGAVAVRGATVTFCCGVVLSVPAAAALRRKLCTDARQSASWLKKASPSFCVQSSLSDIILRTLGNGTSDFTLASSSALPAPLPAHRL